MNIGTIKTRFGSSSCKLFLRKKVTFLFFFAVIGFVNCRFVFSQSVDPSSLDFGDVLVNTSGGLGSELSVLVSNQDVVDEVVNSISSNNGDFTGETIGEDSLPLTIAVGESYPFRVTFDPATLGSSLGDITITTSLRTVIIPVQGNGTNSPNRLTSDIVFLGDVQANDLIEFNVFFESNVDLGLLVWELELDESFEFVSFVENSFRVTADVTVTPPPTTVTNSVRVSLSNFFGTAVSSGSGSLGTITLEATQAFSEEIIPLIFDPTETSANDISLNPVTNIVEQNAEIVVISLPQTFTFDPNKFNFFSLFVEPSSVATADVFGPILGEILIFNDDSGGFFIPAGAVGNSIDLGSLTQLQYSEGYKVFLRDSVTTTVSTSIRGPIVEWKEVTIQCEQNKTNLISYPLFRGGPHASTFPFGVHSRTQVINDDDGRFFIPAGAVGNPVDIGNLTNFVPSEGYTLFPRTTGFTFEYNGTVVDLP